jgi:hypothetical protein
MKKGKLTQVKTCGNKDEKKHKRARTEACGYKDRKKNKKPKTKNQKRKTMNTIKSILLNLGSVSILNYS